MQPAIHLPAIGEEEVADRIAAGIPDVLGMDRARYAGKTTEVALLFRWFVGLGMSERVWDATSFTKNATEEDTSKGKQLTDIVKSGKAPLWK